MKFLSDYTEEKQTKLFNDTNTFFAFSNEQFGKAKKEGVEYVSMGAGMITDKRHIKTLVEGLDHIHKEGIDQDIKENGLDNIIDRELNNHECYYAGDIQPCIDKLSGYNVDEKTIIERFDANYSKQSL